jgi:two-component sensor histidine kinase
MLAGITLAVHRHLSTRRYSAELETMVQQKTESLREKQEALAESLREKEVLLRETHHRVKNNLQIVMSMLSLQSLKVQDPVLRQLYEECTLRILTMARLHEKLHRSENLGSLNFKEYIEGLVNDILSIHGAKSRSIEVIIEAESLVLEIEKAVHCGLILNELVSNALLHAFDGMSGGKIVITFAQDAADVTTLSVKDNGRGLPPDFDVDHMATLGMRLVWSLVQQLGGTLSVRSGPGAHFVVQFPPVPGKRPRRSSSL